MGVGRMRFAAVLAAVMTVALLAVAPGGVSAQRRPSVVRGDRLWSYTIPYSSGWSIAVSPDGRTVFEATSVDWPRYSALVVTALDTSNGQVRWESSFGHDRQSSGVGFAGDVAASEDGRRVFVTGSSRFRMTTVAFAAEDGERLWAARYGSPKCDGSEGRMLALGTSRIFVLGKSKEGCPGPGVIVAYSQSTGQRLWVSKTVPDSWNGLVSGGGGLFTWALGGQPGPPACYVQALAQDTGDQIWSAPCPSLDGDTLRDASLAVGPSNVFVRGNVSSGDAEVWEVGALARADGTQAWLTTFDAGSPEWWGLQALAASPDGSRVFATGTSNPDGIDRFQSVAFDASDGHLLWANTLRLDARPSRSHVLAVSTDGATVYAAGSVTTHCHYDDANEEWYCYEASRTVAYDASTGSVLWVRDMRPGTAGEVAVDPALNRVFVVFGGFDTVVAYKG